MLNERDAGACRGKQLKHLKRQLHDAHNMLKKSGFGGNLVEQVQGVKEQLHIE
jgi:hypothetical protein